MNRKKTKLYFCAGLFLLLTACHSDYLSLDYRILPGSFSDGGKAELAFIIKTSAFRQASGISKFPDGGTPEYLYRELGLYNLDTNSMHLEKLISFSDLANTKFNIANSLKTRISSNDSCIFYQLTPITDWSIYLKWCDNRADSSCIETLKEKYRKSYKIHKQTGQITPLTKEEFDKAFVNKKSFSLSALNKLVENISLSELGLNLMEIYPKENKEYIAETIYLKNSSALTRRAVVEQIISKLKPEDIEALLIEMDSYKDNLEGYEKSKYELYSKDTYELIKILLYDREQ